MIEKALKYEEKASDTEKKLVKECLRELEKKRPLKVEGK